MLQYHENQEPSRQRSTAFACRGSLRGCFSVYYYTKCILKARCACAALKGSMRISNIVLLLNTVTYASKINVSNTKCHQLQRGFIAPIGSRYHARYACMYVCIFNLYVSFIFFLEYIYPGSEALQYY